MNYYIKNIEYYLPEKIIDNQYLSANAGIDIQFLEQKVGIKERRIAAENELSSDMAVSAGKILFEKTDVKPEDIEMLILVTQNPDYRLPTTACLVQNKLGLKKSVMAFDMNLGCSGWTYAVPLAGNFIKNGNFKNALIITSEQYSKIIDYKDKNTASIFGDAAAATLLSACEDGFGVMDYNFGTDGSGADKLICYNSGVFKNNEKSNYLYMDGREIFKFTVVTIPQYINELLKKNNLQMKDFKYVILHQANQYMLKEMQKRLKVSDEQMVIEMEMFGNTVSSTIPIAMKKLLKNSNLNKGDLVLFSGFGVGLSWANIIYIHY